MLIYIGQSNDECDKMRVDVTACSSLHIVVVSVGNYRLIVKCVYREYFLNVVDIRKHTK